MGDDDRDSSFMTFMSSASGVLPDRDARGSMVYCDEGVGMELGCC